MDLLDRWLLPDGDGLFDVWKPLVALAVLLVVFLAVMLAAAVARPVGRLCTAILGVAEDYRP